MDTTTTVLLIGGGVVVIGLVYVIGQNSGQQSVAAMQAPVFNQQTAQQNQDRNLVEGAVRGLIGGLGSLFSSSSSGSNAHSSNNAPTGGNQGATGNPGTSGTPTGTARPPGWVDLGTPTPYRGRV